MCIARIIYSDRSEEKANLKKIVEKLPKLLRGWTARYSKPAIPRSVTTRNLLSGYPLPQSSQSNPLTRPNPLEFAVTTVNL
jgi:hypothetical protein